MPINCPIPLEGSCEGCFRCNGDTCTWHSPPMPLRDILTPHERIDMLAAKVTTLEAAAASTVPNVVLTHMRRELNNTKGMLLHFQTQFNEHIAPDKRKKLQKQAKKKEGGTVEV